MTPASRPTLIVLVWTALVVLLAASPTRAQYFGTWQGFGGLGSGCTAELLAMARASNGDLYVGGRPGACGGVPLRGAVRWDGTEWMALKPDRFGEVTALATGPDDVVYLAELIRGASLNDPWLVVVWRWDGLTMSVARQFSVSSGSLGVRKMLVDRTGVLRLSTEFSATALTEAADGQIWYASVGRIQSSTASAPLPGVFNGTVHQIRVTPAGHLVVGGDFTQIDGQPYARVARWDGSQWQPLGTGLDGLVRDLALVGDSVVVVGDFATAGGVAARGIARWNGQWAGFPEGVGDLAPDFVSATLLVADGDGFYVGGNFSGQPEDPVVRVARWSGERWQALDGNTDAGLDSTTTAGLVHEGELIVSGARRGGGSVLNRLGRWTGASWAAYGGGPGGFVNAFLRLGDGTILAASSSLTLQGSTPIRRTRIQQWNGVSWSTLGDEVVGRVTALSRGPDGAVYAAGDNMPILRWDGATWAPLSQPLNIRTLALDGNRLLAGGFFLSAVNGVAVRGLAAWDGSTWSDAGDDAFQSVYSVVIDQGLRYLATNGGVFERVQGQWVRLGTLAGEIQGLVLTGPHLIAANATNSSLLGSTSQLSRWVAGGWEPIADPIRGEVRGLVPDGEEGLYLLGNFSVIGDRLSTHLARWRPNASFSAPASMPVCTEESLYALAPAALDWAHPGAARCVASEAGAEKTTWTALETLAANPAIRPPARVPAALGLQIHTRGGASGTTTLRLDCSTATGTALPTLTRELALVPGSCAAPDVQVPASLTLSRLLEDGTVRYVAPLTAPEPQRLRAQILRHGARGVARAQVLDSQLVVHYRPDRSPNEGEVLQDTLEVLVGDDRVARRHVYTITVPVRTTRLGGPLLGLQAGSVLQLRDETAGRWVPLSGGESWELGRRLTPGEAYQVTVASDPLGLFCTNQHNGGYLINPPRGLSGYASLRDLLDRLVNCSRPTDQMLVTSPEVAPGGTGRLKLVLDGTEPADFYHSTVCFQSSRLTLGTPQVPPTAEGLVCAVGAASSLCPAGFDRQLQCLRAGGVPTRMGFPQVVEVPLVAGSTPGEARVVFGVRTQLFPHQWTSFIEGQVWIGSGQTIGGSVQGLGPGQSLRLRNHATDEVRVVSANGSYTLAERQGPGSIHRVRVEASPAGLDCRLAHGEGVVGDSPVTTLDVQCVDVQLHRDGFEG